MSFIGVFRMVIVVLGVLGLISFCFLFDLGKDEKRSKNEASNSEKSKPTGKK